MTPFVTRLGARMLLEVAQQSEADRTHWIVGLDGVITTPEALLAIAASRLTGSFRGWRQDPTAPSFHAKVYILFRRYPPKVTLYVGSANATVGGLSENVEAGFFLNREGKRALDVMRLFRGWLREITSSNHCKPLGDKELNTYSSHYTRPRRATRRVAGVIGVERNVPASTKAVGPFTWIEIAVRGGSSNQIEICKDMATFFTRGRQVERADFSLVEQSTGLRFNGNCYRFRLGNFGHRIEVNTDLARAINLKRAAQRRDIALFRSTASPKRFTIELHPAKAETTKKLIKEGDQQGRVHLTTPAAGGRRFYV